MVKFISFFLIFLSSSIFSLVKDEYLVCIHGFMGAPWNMSLLEKNLKQEGYVVINWKYSSREKYIKEHGKQLVKHLIILAKNKPNKPINFVTHSMGSLVLLAALNHSNCPIEAKIGKVVLIAPPLKGSRFGRCLAKFPVARWIAKDYSGRELMTQSNFDYLGNYPSSLKDILIISGSFGFNPTLKEKNDGVVALHETSLSNPHKHLVVKREHMTIIFSKKVCRLTRDFLLK